MPMICYKKRLFTIDKEILIDHCNRIINDLAAQGFTLTLRQLYYQLVSQDIIPNSEKSYKNLESPATILDTCVNSFAIDKWKGQKYRPEVWIEKDALVGVIDGVCREMDVSYFSCRGYTSQSEMWRASMRYREMLTGDPKQMPVVIHLGDHDPSGIDMSRDIADRVGLFLYAGKRAWPIIRIALNMDQVTQYNPPPNPAKFTDSRFKSYEANYGKHCWELDALQPRVIVDLIREEILKWRNEDQFETAVEEEEKGKERLGYLALAEHKKESRDG
jgi:hypothetical protein